MPRLLRTVALASLALLFAAAAGIFWLLWASLPDHEGDVVVFGLDRPVEIVRDEFAIPHVRARTEADLWRALGFVHGTDRPAQLEFTRRLGRGRLAELLGETALPLDRFFRTLGLARAAEAGLSAYRDEERALLDAYAEGVSAAFARARPLPPELLALGADLEPWRAADTLLVHRLMALEVARAWRRELVHARLARMLPADRLAELLAEEEGTTEPAPAGRARLDFSEPAREWFPELSVAGSGSNVFVVAGSRTRSGAPLLASDPHLPFQVPGTWYLAVLETPTLSLAGGTVPGLPAVVIGRNRELAWGMTTTGADTEDLVRLRVDPRDPGRYLLPEGSEAFRVRVETIAVRGRDPERLVVRETRFGPVVTDVVPGARAVAEPGEELVLQWIGLREDDRTLGAGRSIARARSIEEFLAALADFASPVQNLAVADRSGRIGFAVAGRVPARRAHDGALPARAWTGEAEWLGFLPPEALPRRVDPPEGFIANANERPVGVDHPRLLARFWESPLRGIRLRELLVDRRDLDFEAARAIQLDLVSGAARTLLPVLSPLLRRAGLSGEARAAAEALALWDGTMAPDRTEPLLFAAWQEAFERALLEDEVGALARPLFAARPELPARLVDKAPHWCDDVRTPSSEDCATIARAAFLEAFAALSDRLGGDWRRWRWSSEHPAEMLHRPFGELPVLGSLLSLRVPIGGDATSLSVGAFRALGPGGPFPAHHGPGLRLIVDLAEPGIAAVVATGQVGHPLSRHYRDLTGLWARGDLVRLGSGSPESRGGSMLQRLVPGDRR
ncbi:MAG: penicillin acylase family protein [Geminicoccaceae bacterium]|nr:penicillin acylase family protein [Geminicoccaceae bacterium]